MDDNKISVELGLDTSEYRKEIKNVLKDTEELDKNFERKRELQTNIEEAQKEIEKYKNLIKETEKDIDRMSKKVGKSLEIIPQRNPSKFESFKALGSSTLSDIKDPVKINFGSEGIEPIKGFEYELEDSFKKIDFLNQKIADIESNISGWNNEMNSLNDTTQEINSNFTGWKDNAYYVNGEILGTKKEVSEISDDEEDINQNTKEELENRKNINKELKSSNKQSKNLSFSFGSMGRLFRRVGLSIRRQIVTRIASALNPLNAMKKIFTSLTKDISPRLGATFKNIGANFVEYFANSKLFKDMIYQILYVIKLLQDAFNSIAKLLGFRQIDLFKRSAKTAKQLEKSASRTVASFDELNDIGNQGNNQDQTPFSLGELDLKDRSEDIINNFNNIIEKLDKFFNETDFRENGKTLGKKFSDAFNSINWGTLGHTLASGLTGAFETAWGFMEGIDWSKTGKSVSDFVNEFLGKISDFLEKTDWGKLLDDTVNAIIDFAKGIDWEKTAKTISKLLGQLLILSVKVMMLPSNFLAKLIKKIFTKNEESDKESEDSGKNILQGILDGIVNACKNIGTWIWENIFKPFWDGVKSAFGIHSPSTKMMEIGEDIINGLKEGIGDIWSKLKEKWEDLKTKITNKFSEIKTNISNKVEEWKNTIKDKFTWKNIKSSFEEIANNIKNIFSSTGAIGKYFTTKYWTDKFSSIKFPKLKLNLTYDKNVSSTKLLAAKLFGLDGWPKVSISSYAVGSNYIPYDQLAIVHEGEAVIPKKFNEKEYFGGTNDETNSLLEQLIERVENLELNPYITVKDVGEASVRYINQQSRITGRSVI